MTRVLKSTVAAALVFALATAHVEGAVVEAGKTIAAAGNASGAPACASCHGADGLGNAAAGFPRLAGMNAQYLVRQLNDYENGTRNNPVMSAMVKSLTQAERAQVANYYATLPVPAKPMQAGGDAARLASGQRIARDGDWSKGVPACYRCHGPDGSGVPPHFPAIIDQPASYIVAQFTAWKDGARSNDPIGLMKSVALKLDNDEIANVAAWLAANAYPPKR